MHCAQPHCTAPLQHRCYHPLPCLAQEHERKYLSPLRNNLRPVLIGRVADVSHTRGIMRLLQASGDGNFTLVEFVRNVPAYAILSHTWGADEDEVTFKDICKGKGKKKPGYAKLQFCATQAAKDHLEFFWIDTCCIDKSSSAELAEAINSMFKWYRDSTVCYVYLSDVTDPSNSTSRSDEQPVLGYGRWFEHGWTLQELLAPTYLVFFSKDGARIGD